METHEGTKLRFCIPIKSCLTLLRGYNLCMTATPSDYGRTQPHVAKEFLALTPQKILLYTARAFRMRQILVYSFSVLGASVSCGRAGRPLRFIIIRRLFAVTIARFDCLTHYYSSSQFPVVRLPFALVSWLSYTAFPILYIVPSVFPLERSETGFCEKGYVDYFRVEITFFGFFVSSLILRTTNCFDASFRAYFRETRRFGNTTFLKAPGIF